MARKKNSKREKNSQSRKRKTRKSKQDRKSVAKKKRSSTKTTKPKTDKKIKKHLYLPNHPNLTNLPKFLLGSKKRIIITFIISILIGLSVWVFWDLPMPNLESEEFPVSTKLYDRNEQLLFEIYADTRSTPVSIDEIPKEVKQATIAIEDKDFYKHIGFSVTGMIRAAYKSIFKQKLQGGSTLTQQLVKNSLLTPERTIRRKIREFALTVIVEIRYSKDKILELYLNQIPYGSTAYGIGAASELYFDKEVKDLTLAEATLLAGLPASPTRFSPFGANPDLAKGRQELVLKRMVEDGYVTQEQVDSALNEKLKFAQANVPTAPHFSLWVKEQLVEKYGINTVEKGGLRVTTTLDLELQEFAQDTVATEVASLAKYKVGNGAALVTRPKTGEILAMVGSKDYFAEDEDGKVNVVFRERQPGSSIKPLNYALGIRDKKITASTPLADVPTCFSVVGQRGYCPTNYDFSNHNAVQVRYALGNSYNIPAVRVLALNGIKNFVDLATQMGITNWGNPDNYGLSLTLGGGEVRPYDMAVAFGVFANQGVKVPLISILKVEDYKGNVLLEVNPNESEGVRVLDQGVPFIISDILKDNGARSATFGSGSYLNVKGHPEVSVKTGTTNNLRDNWTVGYTGHIATVVWIGNNDNSAMSRAVSGQSGASSIWNIIMKEALEQAEDGRYDESESSHAGPIKPDSVVGATVCSDTGNTANADNPNCPTRFEYFLKDAIGARLQSGIMDIEVDKETRSIADPEHPVELKEMGQHPFVLDPLGTLICLDCPPHKHNVNISYPLSI